MSATARNVDFSGVKDGGNFNKTRIPAGDYLAIITKVEDAEAKDETPQFLFTIKIKKRPSTVLPYYCKLQDNQLWKLRNIFIAAGKNVPKSKQKVDPNSIIGKTIGVTIGDTEYDDKPQSQIDGVFPAAELADSDDSDEVEDVEDDEAADDDLEDLDEAEEEPEEEVETGDEWDNIIDRLELRKALKKLDPEVKTTTSMSDDDIRNLIRAAAGSEDEDIEEDEEEEEEVAPPVKKVAAKPAAKKPAAKKAADISDDELEELDIDNL
jgi:hypothetical protein